MTIHSFEPFGYSGSLVSVECDLRRGIPALDIVGLSDGVVCERRERIRASFRNQKLEFPSERVLVSVSPCDIRKDSESTDLAIALAIALGGMGISDDERSEKIMAVSGLDLHGNLLQKDSVMASFLSLGADAKGFVYITTEKYEEFFKGKDCRYILARTLSEALQKIRDKDYMRGKEKETEKKYFCEETINLSYMLPKRIVKAILLSATSKLNTVILRPCGADSSILTDLITDLTPLPSGEEKISAEKIRALSGISEKKERPSVRIPHPTVSIEGMCGGGAQLRAGEVSLAHGGSLVLSEASEFRFSVLQMLRIPMENHSLTLCRAGRTTVYPCDFSLFTLASPCPCGNFGSKDKICLCSARSIETYQNKLSGQFRFSHFIVTRTEEDERVTFSAEELRKKAERILSLQEGREKNGRMKLEDIKARFLSESFDQKKTCPLFTTQREEKCLYQALLSIANYNGRERIEESDIEEYKDLWKGADKVVTLDRTQAA